MANKKKSLRANKRKRKESESHESEENLINPVKTSSSNKNFKKEVMKPSSSSKRTRRIDPKTVLFWRKSAKKDHENSKKSTKSKKQKQKMSKKILKPKKVDQKMSKSSSKSRKEKQQKFKKSFKTEKANQKNQRIDENQYTPPPSKKPRKDFNRFEKLNVRENKMKNCKGTQKFFQPAKNFMDDHDHCHRPPSKKYPYLENFLNVPGFQHLAENVFLNLSYDDLMSCQILNRSSKRILENPIFWLKKFIRRGLPKKNQNDWNNAIQLTRNSKLEKNILLYLKKSSKHEKLIEIPCYIDKNVVKKSFKISRETDVGNILNWYELEAGFIQMFAPLSRNLNSMIHFGGDEIRDGKIEFVKSLAPLTENPNKPDKNGDTTMHWATDFGHIEIIKYLSTWVDNPVPPNKPRCTCPPQTPLQLAVNRSRFLTKSNNFFSAIPYLEICSLLTPLSKNPKLSMKQIIGLFMAVTELCRHNGSLFTQLMKRFSKFDVKFLEDFLRTNPVIQDIEYLYPNTDLHAYNSDLSNEQMANDVLDLNQRNVFFYTKLKQLEELASKLETKEV